MWDVFFAAVMLGLAGPGHARARDIAYANVITTVYSRTTTGMVPNYRNGQGGATCTYDRTEPMVGSWSLQILHSVFADDWIVELVRDAHDPSHRVAVELTGLWPSAFPAVARLEQVGVGASSRSGQPG